MQKEFQQGLDEAVKNYLKTLHGVNYRSLYDFGQQQTSAFIEGAKWQAKMMYGEEEVKTLLQTQRGNCYVAVLSKCKNEDIAATAIKSPEPGNWNKRK